MRRHGNLFTFITSLVLLPDGYTPEGRARTLPVAQADMRRGRWTSATNVGGTSGHDLTRQEVSVKGRLVEKLLTLLLSAIGAGLVVWRNDAVQDGRLKTLEEAIVNLQTTTVELENAATDLRVAVGVLEERSKSTQSDRRFLPLMSQERKER